MEHLPPPEHGFSDIGILEDGDVDIEQFKSIKECAYMMNFGVKDGTMELEAVGRFDRIDLGFEGNTIQKQAFNGLVHRCRIDSKKNTGKDPTHLDMMNGKFSILEEASTSKFPLDNEEYFLKLYSLVYLQGKKMWFIETRTPVFRFFMDLDFEQPESLTPIKIELIAFVVNRSIKKFFVNENTRMICCTTSFKKVQCSGCICICNEDPGCISCKGTGRTGKNAKGKECDKCAGIHPIKKKTGVHLIWPELYVRTEQCLDMRETVIADLISTFGQRTPPFNDWTEVVDNSVYRMSGLRMVGSRKAEVCPNCKGKRKIADEHCIECRRSGRVDRGRPYAPLFVTDSSGRRDSGKEKEYEANYYLLILDTKIRTNKDCTAGFVIPDGFPLAEPDEKKKNKKTPVRFARVGNDSPEAEAMQTFFKSCPQPKYAELVVTSVLKSSKASNTYLVNVSGLNCTYCQNVGRCHRSNRIYFVVSPDGIAQRCHDTSEKLEGDMKYGLCRDYLSAKMKMSSSITQLLFPEDLPKEASTVLSDAPSITRSSELKLRSLLDAGNRLCKSLYNVEWTSSSRFAAIHGERLMQVHTQMMRADREAYLGKVIFKTFVPSAIGNRSEEDVMIDLGFMEPRPVEKKAKRKEEEKFPSLTDIQDEIHQVLRNIVGVCLNSDESTIVERLKQGLGAIFKGPKASKKRVATVGVLEML
jgi:hypothetical protein